MSVDKLRRAAALMREDVAGVVRPALVESAPRWRAAAEVLSPAERAFVGRLTPAFVLAVADWLDAVAFQAERNPHQNTRMRSALAVARGYLGETGDQ